MEITKALLGTKDLLEIGVKTVEDLTPPLRDCLVALQKYPSSQSSFQGVKNLEAWYKRVSSMKASESLTDEDIRQLKFDLNNTYESFVEYVQH
jgi:ESCRT-I complex subunit VPS28